MKKHHSRHSKHFNKKQSIPNTKSPNETKTQTQKVELMGYLMAGNRITVLTALRLFGVYALSQRLGELRRDKGIPIQSQFIKLPNGKMIKEYWLSPDYIKQHSEATA